MKQLITVRDMRPMQVGRVVDIRGGRGMMNRLQAMGIRPGKKITKVSSMFMRGPVTIEVDNFRVAIGFGMAGRILVEADTGGNE